MMRIRIAARRCAIIAVLGTVNLMTVGILLSDLGDAERVNKEMKINRNLCMMVTCLLPCLTVLGCTQLPDAVTVERLEEDINESDPVCNYLNTTIGEINIEYEEVDRDKKTDTIQVSTISYYPAFKYKCDYELVYAADRDEQEDAWILNTITPMEDKIRIYPSYDYSGTWATLEEHPRVFWLDDIEWEKGKLRCGTGTESIKKLKFFCEQQDVRLSLGIYALSGEKDFVDNVALVFLYENSVPEDKQPFKLYYSGKKAVRILSTCMDFGEGYDLLNDKTCMELRTEDGTVIANADMLTSVGGIIASDGVMTSGVQLDFGYGLENVFMPYLGQKVGIFSYGKKVGIGLIEDISPFLSIIVTADSDEAVDIGEIDNFSNALNIYMDQF